MLVALRAPCLALHLSRAHRDAPSDLGVIFRSLKVLALFDSLLVVSAAHTVRRVQALAWANRLGRLQPYLILLSPFRTGVADR
jgi:hypothetical protein